MSDSTSTTQKDNTVYGPQAGRDIDIHYHPKEKSRNKEVIEQYKKDLISKPGCKDFIDDLQHYCNQKEGEKVIGLEAKLKEGNYEELLEFAKDTKERFFKKLVKTQFSESGQELLLYLLTDIHSRFHMHVKPLLAKGAEKNEVTKAIQELIIDEISESVEADVLKLYKDEVNGMIYFLTGNCFIRWK